MNLHISRPINPGAKNVFQIGLVVICVLLNMLDGFETLATTFVAPYLSVDWHLTGEQTGVLFSSGLLGMCIGNLFITPQADRIGRRPTILLALCVLVVGMSLSSMAQTLWQFAAFRAITGIGIGTLLPCLAVIVSEYTTDKWRTAAIGALGTGFAAGAMIGGAISSHLLAHYSWRSVFLFGALATVVMIPVVLAWLPESLELLVLKKRPDALQRINHILMRMRYQPLTQLPAASAARINVGLLARLATILGGGYRKRTLMLWIAQFALAMSFYVIMSWTPKLATQMGYTKQAAVFAGVLLNVGGMAGSIIMALLSTKVRLSRLLTGYLLLSAVVVGLFGVCGQLKDALVIFPILMGLALNGAVAGMFSLAPTLYAAEVRAMGMGWLQGVSRVGGVLGPMLVGIMVDTGWRVGDVFKVQVVPLIISMIAVTVIFTAINRSAVGGVVQRAQ